MEDFMFYTLVFCHACLMIVQEEEKDGSMINNRSLAHKQWDWSLKQRRSKLQENPDVALLERTDRCLTTAFKYLVAKNMGQIQNP